MIYLDNAATTAIDSEVLEAMMPYLTYKYGNAGSLHAMGRTAYNAVQHAREQVAKFINASPEQIIFTSGGTEANNMVIYNAYKYPAYDCFISTATEHDSILNYLNKIKYWEENQFKIDLIQPSKTGTIDLGVLDDMIKERHGNVNLISVMHTNNELGSINPIKEIGDMCEGYQIEFHTDCVQAAGFSKIDVKEFNCNYLTLSSHKVHGPKGVGALFIRNPNWFTTFIFGGKSQEFGFRGGTENVAGIVGFGKACELSGEYLEFNMHKITSCVNAFSEAIETRMMTNDIIDALHYNTQVNEPTKVLNIRFDGVKAETLLMALDAQRVYVSAGSACNASDGEPSHVLKAIGLTDEEAKSSIRVSFSKMNTPEECSEAGKIVADTVKMLLEI